MRFSISSIMFFSALFASASASSSHHHHARHAAHVRRQGLTNRLDTASLHDVKLPSLRKRRTNSQRCKAPSASSSSSSSFAEVASSTSSGASYKASTVAAPPTSTTPASGSPPTDGKPANWPTKTQAGATYSATATSASDPMLLSISEALNNKNNNLFTSKKTGDLTYYGQGLGACGDTYDDSTYTAAISEHLYDIWPGANGEQNRNPVCGPFTPGRSILNTQGVFAMAVKSSVGSIMIGGDGLPNCNPAPGTQCHIPLTATITNPATGKSVIVSIVDRCVGCAEGDIDVTPTAFSAIADMSLGRVPGITWQFNDY